MCIRDRCVCVVILFHPIAEYKKISPQFHRFQEPDKFPHQNRFLLCNASISGDANLEWRTDSVTVQFFSNSNVTSWSDLSPSVVDTLCLENSPTKEFSIRFENSYLTDSTGAKFLNQEIALVLCDIGQSSSRITYTCYSSDSDAKGPTFTIPPTSSNNFLFPVVATVVAIVLILSLVLLIVVACACVYYSRLKAEPPRMCPIDPHLSATASLITATMAPYDMETTDGSYLEFPRENLEFVKVLGKQHFSSLSLSLSLSLVYVVHSVAALTEH